MFRIRLAVTEVFERNLFVPCVVTQMEFIHHAESRWFTLSAELNTKLLARTRRPPGIFKYLRSLERTPRMQSYEFPLIFLFLVVRTLFGNCFYQFSFFYRTLGVLSVYKFTISGRIDISKLSSDYVLTNT